ncbi:MAG TPA: L-threonylcarbamoyladenylate synthase [bacterium]|nr:L-threonylcarbamoyladenylate synthase [bacterium]
MQRIPVHPRTPHKRTVETVADALGSGGVALIPGDTSYLLAVRIGKKSAIEKLGRIKDRKKKFYSVMFRDFSELARYAEVTDRQFATVKRFLPGPYTFILKASREVPKIMLENRKEIGIRIPDLPFIRELIAACGEPLIVSTAKGGNDEEEEFFTDPDSETPPWLHLVDIIADAGYQPAELTSIIRLENDRYEVVRAGKGPVEEFS